MKVTYTIVSDTVTPDIRARLARVQNPEPAMRRMGEVLANWARQAFRDTSKRPAAWPQLSDKTLAQKKKKGYGNKPLIASGALARLGGEAADPDEGLARSGAELAAVAHFAALLPRRLSHPPPFSKPRRKNVGQIQSIA